MLLRQSKHREVPSALVTTYSFSHNYLLSTYSMPGMVLSFRENVYTHIYTHTQLYDKVNLMEQGKTVEPGPQSHTRPPILASKVISGSAWLATEVLFVDINPGIGKTG